MVFIVLVLLELISLVAAILVPIIELLILVALIGLVAVVVVPAVVRNPRRRAAAYAGSLVLGVVVGYVVFVGPVVHGWAPLAPGGWSSLPAWALGLVVLFLGGLLIVAALGLIAAIRARRRNRGVELSSEDEG